MQLLYHQADVADCPAFGHDGGNFKSILTLATGVLPFTITPPSAVSAEAIPCHQLEFKQNADHATLMEGSMSIINADEWAL